MIKINKLILFLHKKIITYLNPATQSIPIVAKVKM